MANVPPNPYRVEFYPPASGFHDHYDLRIREVLTKHERDCALGVNDAIELFECKRTLDDCPGIFGADELEVLRTKCKDAFKDACKSLNLDLSTKGLVALYEEVEPQYEKTLLRFISASGAHRHISDDELHHLVKVAPSQLVCALEDDKTVKVFARQLRELLLSNPILTTEIVLDRFATQQCFSDVRPGLSLPASLTAEDIEQCMDQYLSSDAADLSHVQLIARWPSRASIGSISFTPSIDLQVKAQNCVRLLWPSVLSSGYSLPLYVEVSIVDDVALPKDAQFSDGRLLVRYDKRWLSSDLSYPTVLNNLAYVLGLVDHDGLATAPRRPDDEDITSLFMSYPVGAYSQPISFVMREADCIGSVSQYRRFLLSHGVRIEDVLEWGFGSYLAEEFGVSGFRIRLPGDGTNLFDACKCMGVEIERMAKEYLLFVERGFVSDDYMERTTFKKFGSIPSLIADKYAIAAPQFGSVAGALTMDLALMLADANLEEPRRNAFELLSDRVIRLQDVRLERREQFIELFIDGDLVVAADDGRLLLTDEAYLLYGVRTRGAVACYRLSEKHRSVASGLVEKGLLQYVSDLLTPREADYMNYVYGDAGFSNSLGLRNRHDHATSLADSRSDAILEEHYNRLLLLLIMLFLKIYDDIVFGTGGRSVVDGVEWV